MRNLKHLEHCRVNLGFMGSGDEYNGMFEMRLPGSALMFRIVASNGAGWEHVSVSTSERVPKWSEMQKVKELFFKDDEVVMQLHPRKADYVNMHPHCLHMWRPTNGEIPTPPKWMVGE